MDGNSDKIMDPLAIFWVLTNSSYLGKYMSLSLTHFPIIYDDDCKKDELKKEGKLLGLMPIG